MSRHAEVEIGPASPQELALSLERAADAFGSSKVRCYLRPDGGGISEGARCIVARVGAEVCSSLFVRELSVFWPTRADGEGPAIIGERRLLGLLGLLTPPEFQGRGLAGALLDWTHEMAREGGFVASALFSEIGPDFYGRRGFTSVPLPFLRGPLPGSASGRAGRPRPGRPYTEDDLLRVAQIYTATASACPPSIARDLAYWRRQLEALPFSEDLRSTGSTTRDFVVTSGEVVAYVRSRSDGDIFSVLEVAWLPGAEADAALLMRGEMDRAADEGCVRALLHLPPGWSATPGTTWREVRREGLMLRPAYGNLDDLEGFQPYVFRSDYF